MEPFTTGLVSADARTAYLENHASMHSAFEGPIRRRGLYGYRMIAWRSQITMARACGRGRRSGRGLRPHLFDSPENP